MTQAPHVAKILVVDDEPLNRLLLRTILEHDGYVVLEAGDGAAALEIATRERPNLLIMDLHMPGMDGAALLKRLRGDSAFAQTVIAIYTATTTSQAMRDFIKLNRVHFTIPKPCDPGTVSHLVREALKGLRRE